MEKNIEVQRDSNGDIISPQIPKDLIELMNPDPRVYVFHFKDQFGNFIEVDYEKNPFNERTDLPKINTTQYNLFQTDQPAEVARK